MPLRSLFLAVLVAGSFVLSSGCSKEDKAPPVFKIVTVSFPQAHQGLPYSHTAVAENGVAPFTWAIVSGNLPAGLNLNTATGEISGTPTALETAGFTLQVTETAGLSVQKAFTITVTVPPLTITTRRLPFAQVGALYNVSLLHVGGSGALTWTLDSGSIPSGLGLNGASGIIQGTPAGGATPSAFTIKVTDGTEVDTQLLAIEIDPAAMTLVKVRQDGFGGAYTSLTAALGPAALPNPITQTHVIEIDDDLTYTENVVVSFTGQTGTEWLSIRSAYDHFPTIRAAVTGIHAVHIQSDNVELRGLGIMGASAACGVKVDNALSQIYVVNCVIHGNQTAFESGSAPGISFINNSCHGLQGVHASGGGSCVIQNNIIFATGPWAIQSLICTADYNLYHAPNGAVGFDGTNTYADLTSWQGSGIGGDTNSLSGDPQFVDPTNDDFHIRSTSQAKDTGGSTGWFIPVTDAEGYARGVGAGFDMGAFEWRP